MLMASVHWGARADGKAGNGPGWARQGNPGCAIGHWPWEYYAGAAAHAKQATQRHWPDVHMHPHRGPGSASPQNGHCGPGPRHPSMAQVGARAYGRPRSSAPTFMKMHGARSQTVPWMGTSMSFHHALCSHTSVFIPPACRLQPHLQLLLNSYNLIF